MPTAQILDNCQLSIQNDDPEGRPM